MEHKCKIFKKGNKQSGITLVALVVTIVVLLILAGVSIRLVLDNNGIINKAGEASSRSKEESAKEKVELMLSDYYMESFGGETDLVSFLEDQEGVDSVTDNGDGNITVEIDGYEVVVDISRLEVTSCEKSGGVRPEAEYAIYQTTGAATVEGTTYTEVVVTVKVTNKSSLDSVDEIKMKDSKGNEFTKESSVIGDSSADASFKVSKNGKYTVTIKGTTDGTQKTKTIRGKITVVAFDRYKTEGKIEVVFIDMDNQIIPSPLEPKLVGNMKPIKLNSKGTDFEEVEKSNWSYNYVAGQGTQENTQSIWANAKTSDGSMFVWIPRYAYKITYYDTDGITVLGYSNAEGIVDVDGNVIQENGTGIQTVGDYIVHPAFTANASIGGGFDDGSRKGVTGLWVGKFETTGTASEPTVKPGATTLRGQTLNEKYKTGKSATFGENVTINSHMAKNSEWGAIAYLAHSQYGTNGKRVGKNARDCTPAGGTSTISTIYTDYVNNSTTHNAYGIYDLNGGASEIVASYVNNGSSYLSTYGGTTAGDLYGATDEERATSTAYKTVYSGSGTQTTNYTTSASMKGDAVYETSRSALSSVGSWFSATSYFPNSRYPFFERGGVYTTRAKYTGTFNFDRLSGSADSSFEGFRVCLAF